MSRFILFFAFTLGPAIISGLVSCNDGCRGYEYAIGGYQVNLFRNEKGHPNQSDSKRLVAGDTVSFRSLEIAMQAKTIILTYGAADGGNLMACDPVNNTADKLQAITVFSDQAYTNDLPAGTNLAGIVGLAGGSFSASTRSLTTLPVNPLPADELSNLLLLKAPDRVVRHRLTITVQLANGKQFTTISEPVVIKP